jgi:hypothetical protein
MERRFMNGRFIRAAVGAVTAGRFINLVRDADRRPFHPEHGHASGGGVYARCHTMVRDSVFARNTAGSQGGGIYNGLRHHGGHFPRFLLRELSGR